MADLSKLGPSAILAAGIQLASVPGAPDANLATIERLARVLKRDQPLLSLHGHIHESRGQTTIGRTVSVNPGSEYGEGVLRGAIVTLAGDRVDNVQLTSG